MVHQVSSAHLCGAVVPDPVPRTVKTLEMNWGRPLDQAPGRENLESVALPDLFDPMKKFEHWVNTGLEWCLANAAHLEGFIFVRGNTITQIDVIKPYRGCLDRSRVYKPELAAL